MKKLFILCLFSFIISVNGGISSFVSKENKLYASCQKYRTEKVDLSNYKNYAINKEDSLKQCVRKLIILNRCVKPVIVNGDINSLFQFMLKNTHLAYQKFPNSPITASLYAWYCKMVKGNITDSLPVILPFIQEGENYPIVTRIIHGIFLNQYNMRSETLSIVTDLGDGNGKIGLKKIKLLCTYWLAKINPEYTNKPAKYIFAARKSMTLEKTHEALEAWKKILNHLDKEKKWILKNQIFKGHIRIHRELMKENKALKEKLKIKHTNR